MRFLKEGTACARLGATAFVLVLALAISLPGASAKEINFGTPDVNADVKGVSHEVDTGQYVQAGPAVTTEVRTQDTEASLTGVQCGMEFEKNPKLQQTPATCEGGQLATTANADLVKANVGLRFVPVETAALAPAPDAGVESVNVMEAASAPTVLLAAAAAGASVALLYAAWRVLKWTGLAAILPLYSHISDNEILDDANRAAIYRLIQAEPGISTKDVAERLGLAWGTVTHHLGKLEKRRFVVSKKYGKYRRYFANGAGGADQKDALAVLRLDRTGDVAALIQANPGMTQKAVSQALGVSSSTILWHVKRLEEVHLVTKVREGKIVRYYPGTGMQGVTIIPGAPVGPTAA